MSELTSEYRIVKAKPRSKKLKPRVDLAAMVSISFLLIMFFMVNEVLSRPQAMDLGVPDCGGCYFGGCWKPDENRIITLLLDGDNKVISYSGLLEIPIEKPKRLSYGKEGIRKELMTMNERIKNYMALHGHRRGDGAIVLIKPSKKSNYGNLIDILDEMEINKIPTYSIVNDFSVGEYNLLASK